MFESETIRKISRIFPLTKKNAQCLMFDYSLKKTSFTLRLCLCYLRSWVDAPRDIRFYKKFFLTVNFPFTNLVIDAKFSFQVFRLSSFLNPWEVKLRGKRHVNLLTIYLLFLESLNYSPFYFVRKFFSFLLFSFPYLIYY